MSTSSQSPDRQSPAQPSAAAPSADEAPTPRSGRAHHRYTGRDMVVLPVPGLGAVTVSKPEIAYVSGIVGLGLLGLIEWPIALVMAGGHVLAADRSSRSAQELGAAMEAV